MLSTNSTDTQSVVLKTTFEILQSPDRISLGDTLIEMSVMRGDGSHLDDEEKLLAYAIGRRIAVTYFSVSSTPLCLELKIVLDALLRERYSQVTFSPAVVTITKRYDHNYSFVGGIVEVRATRGHGNVRNVLAKI